MIIIHVLLKTNSIIFAEILLILQEVSCHAFYSYNQSQPHGY